MWTTGVCPRKKGEWSSQDSHTQIDPTISMRSLIHQIMNYDLMPFEPAKNELRKKMKTVKISIILLALLLAGMIVVPAVSAATALEGKTIAWNATPEQVAKINELWGKDITIGEYYEQVCPVFLVNMPADLKEKLYTKKWNWGNGA